MNQSILFNDDLQFDGEHQAWHFSGLWQGELIHIYIADMVLGADYQPTLADRFDWEERAEQWLQQHEPDHQSAIWLK